MCSTSFCLFGDPNFQYSTSNYVEGLSIPVYCVLLSLIFHIQRSRIPQHLHDHVKSVCVHRRFGFSTYRSLMVTHVVLIDETLINFSGACISIFRNSTLLSACGSIYSTHNLTSGTRWIPYGLYKRWWFTIDLEIITCSEDSPISKHLNCPQ